jgi:hypothetical protein
MPAAISSSQSGPAARLVRACLGFLSLPHRTRRVGVFQGKRLKKAHGVRRFLTSAVAECSCTMQSLNITNIPVTCQ